MFARSFSLLKIIKAEKEQAIDLEHLNKVITFYFQTKFINFYRS